MWNMDWECGCRFIIQVNIEHGLGMWIGNVDREFEDGLCTW